ncbi:L,D-transpeptidase [Priestia megaterium]|uniref:L,D-transpeptidase n=1 Tax=Priestia megaterium TaxID=1404 RepID=UPI001CB9AC2A|nr:L,D-transpeptidase [Priestia megaterium]
MANRISRTTIVLIAAILALACLFVGVPKTEAASTPSHLIIINKATNKLAYYQNGSLVRTFSVATGRTQSLTPEGHFKVVNKIVNRPYYSGNIPGGDPRNPLGNRWLGQMREVHTARRMLFMEIIILLHWQICKQRMRSYVR